MSRLTLVKNAFADICRGGATALVVLLLPPVLTRTLSKDAYGTWLLILQLSTYVSFLDFGIQKAVGRYIAHHNELSEFRERDNVVSTALAILTGSAIIAAFGISTLAWQLPHLFQDLPLELRQDAQIALCLVGNSLAVSLPFSVFGAIFIGLERYDIPAWINGSSKLLGGLFVVLVAQSSHSIVMMAIVMAIVNVSSGLWQFLAYKRFASDICISTTGISKATGREITSYCFSFTIWTLGMILVSGLDTIITGYFDYSSVVYYSLAASLTGFVTNLHSAIFGAIMPKAAGLGARKDRKALGNLLVSTTRHGMIVLMITTLPLVFGGHLLLTLWVGNSYAEKTTLLLQLIAVANCIRYITAPYSTIVLAIGDQNKIILTPVLEGFVNVIISVFLSSYYGVIGVVIGTFCGAVLNTTLNFFYNLPRTISIEIENPILLINAVFKPFVAVIPSIIMWIIFNQMNLSSSLEIICLIATIVTSYLFLWYFAISTGEKQQVVIAIKSRLKTRHVN
jgi:O-antigen/teichoic acid export membrane protein